MKKAWLLSLAFLALTSQSAVGGPESAAGEWRGTSLCTNRELAPACKDEKVEFVFVKGGAGSPFMHLDGRKLVGSSYESMGEMDLQYSSAADEWTYLPECPVRLAGVAPELDAIRWLTSASPSSYGRPARR